MSTRVRTECDICGREDVVESVAGFDYCSRHTPRFRAGDRADLRLDKLRGSNTGTIVNIVRQLTRSEADAEAGPMYEITMHVFEDEIGELEE